MGGMRSVRQGKMYGLPLRCFGAVASLSQNVTWLREKAKLLVILQTENLSSICISLYLQS